MELKKKKKKGHTGGWDGKRNTLKTVLDQRNDK